jgi:deoxycytidylate deaminase
LIVDDEDNIISSGFNEVPRDYRPCRDDFGKCRRDKAKKDCLDGIREDLPAEILEKYPNIAETVSKQFSQNFKNLDICRALHAEENAIINLARNGRSVPLSQCTLYTTTYPCRLCANKIVNLGIKHLIYLEPYPDPEAKSILKSAGTKDEFFEGITFKAFSRVYGEKK